MNNALQALLEKKRPYHEFEFEGQKLFARKMGSTDESALAESHKTVFDSYVFDEDEEKKVEFSLRRSSKEDLADYILLTDEREMIDEAAQLLGQERDSEEVKEYVKEQTAERKVSLITEEFDHLLSKALDRRIRIAALIKANQEFIKEGVLRTVFIEEADGTKKPFFNTVEELGELPTSDIRTLNEEVNKALIAGDPFRVERVADSTESVDDSKKTRGRRRNADANT